MMPLSISKIRVSRVDKLDLLIVVDNSSSMADKQAELARQLPEILGELIDPEPDPATGRRARFSDVHVGVITSSLGSHGTSACSVALSNPTSDDRGHLLPRANECATAVAATPLSWAFRPGADQAAEALQLGAVTSCVIASAGEKGCGYEETWEALYHFLVDPAPYAKAEATCSFGTGGDDCENKIVVGGLDTELLAQRKAFLRHDSMLEVIVLSDENDASLRPAGLNWLPWAHAAGTMPRGFSSCANVPDDFEPESPADFAKLHDDYKCWSCFERPDDPSCSLPWAGDPLNNDVDGRSLRAMQQTKRFGYNFLWGRQRYVDAFTKGQVVGSDNKLAPNPIFAGGFRTSDLIVVATIVGVSPRLVANSDGTPKDLSSSDWDLIAGPIGKRDLHMIESIKPRDGLARFAGDRSVDPVNGGDRDIVDGDDLQDACIERRTSTAPTVDCVGPDAHQKNPLCGASNTQPFFKAYPGLRHLRIARDLGISGYVASICGGSYRPAIRGLTEKLNAVVSAQCLRTSLSVDSEGRVDCLLVESLAAGTDEGKSCEQLGPGLCTPGAEPCRREDSSYPPVSPAEASAHLTLPITVIAADGTGRSERTSTHVEKGNVYVTGNGQRHLVCELAQFGGAALQACITDPAFAVDAEKDGGFCYTGRENLPRVAPKCLKIGAPGTVRYFGGAEPRNGSEVFTFCAEGGRLCDQ